MPNGGTLHVRVLSRVDEPGRGISSPATSMVVVEIEDEGVGMSKEHMEQIFDPFFTTKDVGEGTGLGLSVSYGIVTDHGGKIAVSSQLGMGSTFAVCLPLATYSS
jgi:signal transduction histidine kinase